MSSLLKSFEALFGSANERKCAILPSRSDASFEMDVRGRRCQVVRKREKPADCNLNISRQISFPLAAMHKSQKLYPVTNRAVQLRFGELTKKNAGK